MAKNRRDNPPAPSQADDPTAHAKENQTNFFQANQFNISPGIDPTQLAVLAKENQEMANQLIAIEKKPSHSTLNSWRVALSS